LKENRFLSKSNAYSSRVKRNY